MSGLRKLMDGHGLLGRAITMTLDEAVGYDSVAITRIVPATVEAVESEELSDCGLLLAVSPAFVFGGHAHARVWACAVEGADPLHSTFAADPIEAELLDETREHALMHAMLHVR